MKKNSTRPLMRGDRWTPAPPARYEKGDFLLVDDAARTVLAVSGNSDFWDVPEAAPQVRGRTCFIAKLVKPTTQECLVLETGVSS
jgi:hypothetical protein